MRQGYGDPYDESQPLDMIASYLDDGSDGAIRSNNRARDLADALIDRLRGIGWELAPAGDLSTAIDALDEVMTFDKGPSEPEWIDWANRNLPLVQRHGKQPSTIGFS